MNSKNTNECKNARPELDESFSHGRCFPTARDKAIKNELSAGELQYFRALMLHYRETGNTYIAVEALVEMVRRGTTPPVWVLESLAEAFSQYPEKPYPKELKRVSNLNGHEYRRYRQRSLRSFAMIDFAKLMGPDFDVSEEMAAELVILKHKVKIEPKSLVNRYHEEWIKFYEVLGVIPLKEMNESELRQFIRTFPEVAQGHIKSTPVKT